ncbi:MAG: Fic family protein [Chloroflexota bacterium]|nr:Fic family protein [Chloroflexota bacterium]MDE2839173.1 Fic family protein [Chloroflexota bacterium]MDE2930155.1 Fic family protein [Chloroflexota bacterium]
MANVLETITKLKRELDGLRPLPQTVLAQVEQKLRLEANYHSNAIEGNTLTLGETRSLILHGVTARGKPLRDHLDIQGHDKAVKAIEDAVKDNQELNEVFIRNLHRVLLKEPYKTKAETPEGTLIERTISLGDYKTVPNNVRTATGETYFFTPPEQVKQAMGDLIDWYRAKEREGEHPIVIAATFHYRFVHIHPFDDGNGRMARLLMNMVLIKHGYTVAMIRRENRDEYLSKLEHVDKTEDLTEFINYIAECCEYALNLYLKAARGEPIDDIDDIDKEIALFKQSHARTNVQGFSSKSFVKSVLSPFYEYCSGKVWSISDAFGNVDVTIDVEGTDIEDKPIQPCRFGINEGSPTLQSLLDSENVPDEMGSISTVFSSGFSRFRQREGEGINLRVENNTDADRCRWQFYSEVLGVQRSHEGRDLDDLKRLYDDLLRELMKYLDRSNP